MNILLYGNMIYIGQDGKVPERMGGGWMGRCNLTISVYLPVNESINKNSCDTRASAKLHCERLQKCTCCGIFFTLLLYLPFFF